MLLQMEMIPILGRFFSRLPRSKKLVSPFNLVSQPGMTKDITVMLRGETKHGLSPLLAASVSNRPYDHADAQVRNLPNKDS
jgi:hypothetical protein